ncbi:MAG: T9SS type A sorting domain-containing protein, partial [Lentimicrobium sp.]|nr:T9SS type A sorting domain-containing protein [Lentimicrobium sp.]
NPSNGSFTVGIGKPESIMEIRLTDMAGKIIFQKKLKNQPKVSIDKLPGGTYILTIINKEKRSTNMKIVSCR